ncbi:hypothetical protein QYE76_014916 [Lolium multiflorum]|uniref:Reverse transcriptase domain-containing protein n=1 Tax=Lolium multiflorum TaxID=4521 RepID=A0AAD8U751_LOLMU|nr:hypothetical protein QYE76_014916 [Lolium multiflorum]
MDACAYLEEPIIMTFGEFRFGVNKEGSYRLEVPISSEFSAVDSNFSSSDEEFSSPYFIDNKASGKLAKIFSNTSFESSADSFISSDSDSVDSFNFIDKSAAIGKKARPSNRAQKVISRQVFMAEKMPPPTVEYLNWSGQDMGFTIADHPQQVPRPGQSALILPAVIAGFDVSRVFIDGGSSLNLMYADTLRKMNISLANLKPTDTRFHGITPEKPSYPLGKINLDVQFGTRENYRIENLVRSGGFPVAISRLVGTTSVCQIRLKEEDEAKTAFITPYGVFCYKTMPFGLKNAGATYQRMMQKCLATQIGKNVQVYIDDVVITSKKGSTLIEDLKETFDNLDKFCLKLNPTKCSFGVPAGELLGFLVSARGIEANPEKIQAIVTMRKPTKLKEIQQLTGRVAALSRFVARLGEKALPFYALIKQGEKFQWNEEADRAFENLKRAISTPPILVAPKEKEPLLLYIAATPQVVSTALVVEREEEGKLHGVQRPVYFISEVLSPSKQRSNVDPNNVPLASLVAQEENVDVNFIKNNNFNNNAYRNNSGNNYRPYPSANGNGYGNSYGNSYNNNRNVPSGLEAMLKEFISTQTAFNKSVEEKLDKIDTIASRVDRLASDVNLLKLKVMPNNDIDNKITTTANAIQVRINENIRLMAELRARWDREENEKLAKENNVAKVWTITTTSNANSSHVAAPPTINGKIIGVGNVSTPSAKRTKLPEIAKTAETACDKTAEIFSNLGDNDPIAVAHNDLDFDDCHISEVIKFLQKLAKSPNASAINLAFTKHITNALIKAREEKLKLETSIPRKLEDGWEPIIKMKFNDFECNALCDLGASISVMPKKIYDMLDLPPLKNCYLDVNLADNVKKKPLGRIDNVHITGPIFARSFQKTEDLTKWGHEEARGWRGPGPGRADLAPGPLVWPLALTLRLLKASVAKPPVESHDTENLTETPPPRIPSRGIQEIASGTLPERGFISRRTLHRHGRLRSDE